MTRDTVALPTALAGLLRFAAAGEQALLAADGFRPDNPDLRANASRDPDLTEVRASALLEALT
jgi:hypothetical protein